MSIKIRFPTAVRKPVKAEIDIYFRISSANSDNFFHPLTDIFFTAVDAIAYIGKVN